MLLVVAAYGNAVGGAFIWDDKVTILENAYIRSLTNIPLFFKSPFFGLGSAAQRHDQLDYYRPLVSTVFALEYRLFGRLPAGYHLVSIFFHSLNVLLVFLLLRTFAPVAVSFWGSALFAVHPVHSTNVAYISGLPNLLVSAACLGALHWYIRRKYWYAFFCFMCGLLCKETALVLPAALIGYQWLIVRTAKGAVRKLLPFVALAAVFMFVRMAVLGGAPAVAGAGISRMAAFFSSVFMYLKLSIVPLGLHFERFAPAQRHLFEPAALAGLACTIVLIAAAYASARSKPFVAFGVFWFFVLLIPTAHIVPLVVDGRFLASEHFLYLAQAGLCMALAASPVFRSRYLQGAAAAMTALFIAATCMYNQRQWHDEAGFYEYNLFFSSSSRLYNNAGSLRESLGDARGARSLYESALAANPRYIQARYNLATLLAKEGKLADAETHLCRLIEQSPGHAKGYNNLGVIRLRQGRINEALMLFANALALERDSAITHRNIALAYDSQGLKEHAVHHYEQSLRFEPDNTEALGALGVLYATLGRYDEARKALTRAFERDAENWQALHNLGNVYFIEGTYDEAARCYERVLAVNPQCLQARSKLEACRKEMPDGGEER